MRKELVEQVVEEAKNGGANLVIWDYRDTFTVENDDVSEIQVADDHLRVKMQDGKATVFVEYDSIYKLVVDKDRAVGGRPGARAGFGATGS